ncbi:MAG: hypothetical protein HC942_11125 [Microcoleus sp. SU_5_6]|nr:hypothetical protein [Microcoleus sp. SU_5_6]
MVENLNISTILQAIAPEEGRRKKRRVREGLTTVRRERERAGEREREEGEGLLMPYVLCPITNSPCAFQKKMREQSTIADCPRLPIL